MDNMLDPSVSEAALVVILSGFRDGLFMNDSFILCLSDK